MNRLRDVREDNDLKQGDIAKILNISRQYYSRYEIGEVDLPIRHYITLSRFYNVSIDYLAGVVNTEKPLYNSETFTEEEIKLIRIYRKNKKVQEALNILLGLK